MKTNLKTKNKNMKQKRDNSGRFTSTAIKIRKFIVKWFVILIMVAVPCFGGYMMFHNWLVSEFVYASTDVAYTAPKTEDNRSLQEKVWEMLDEYGLTLDEKIEATQIINCESRWNQYAINKNTDGSFDLGLFQINERYHPIPRECLLNLECNIKTAMELYSKQGWTPWVCKKVL